MLPKYPCKLQEGGISGRVVANAHVPTVVMTMHEHKFLGFALTPDFDHRHLLLVPALLQGGHYAGTGSRLRQRDQLTSVGIVDGHNRDPRLARQIVEIGCAPDRRADTPVDVRAGIRSEERRVGEACTYGR